MRNSGAGAPAAAKYAYEQLRGNLVPRRPPEPEEGAGPTWEDRLGLGAPSYVYEPRRLPEQPAPGVEVEVLHDRPFVAKFKDVFSKSECKELRQLGEANATQSTVIFPYNLLPFRARVGRSVYFRDPSQHSPLVARANLRLAEVGGFKNEEAEPMSINGYDRGGYFRPHHDFFPEGSSVVKEFGQRRATIIAYLNTPESGGATLFPSLKTSVPAVEGTGVYFEYGNSRGQVCVYMLHAGEIIREGQKWFAQRLIHNEPVVCRWGGVDQRKYADSAAKGNR